MLSIQEEALRIPTADGHTLGVSKFVPAQDVSYAMVITSATGVLQKYYAKFAHFFATKGFTVYTFDYHGIGASSGTEKELKNNDSEVTSWGQNDQAAVVAFAKKENNDSKLILVAHSIGGQILGFNPNYHLLDKVVLVGCQTGYWKYFSGMHRIKMWTFWYVMIPILTPLFGYFPAKKLGLFENLPKPLVYQWARWGRKPNYLMYDFDAHDFLFNEFKIPMLSLSFSKDSFAPEAAVDWLAKQYKNAVIQRKHHHPQKGERHVKHFGFFKAWAQQPFWEQCHNYIVNGSYES